MRRLGRRLASLVLAMCLLMVGCGGDPDRETTPEPALPAATVTPEAPTAVEGDVATADPAAVIEYGPAMLVAGLEDCLLVGTAGAEVTHADDGTTRYRDGSFNCTVTNNDPRISGTAHYTWSADLWGASPQDAAQVQWGTIRIENDGGTWEADYFGIYTGEFGDVVTALFGGTGDYEGLSYYQWAVETFGASWPTRGLIFPGDSSTFANVRAPNLEATTPSPTERLHDLPEPIVVGPTVLVAGWEDCELNPPAQMPVQTSVEGTAQFRGGEFDCTVTNNDPRIAGTAHSTLDLDRWGTSDVTSAQVQWGTTRIENEGGTWETEYVGVYTGETGDVVTGLYAGTGDYEGLSYYQWAVETFGASWPTRGLIFPTPDPWPSRRARTIERNSLRRAAWTTTRIKSSAHDRCGRGVGLLARPASSGSGPDAVLRQRPSDRFRVDAVVVAESGNRGSVAVERGGFTDLLIAQSACRASAGECLTLRSRPTGQAGTSTTE